MTRSRIFEEYAKIATERGLVSPSRVKNAEDAHSFDPPADMKEQKHTTRDNYKPKELSSTEVLYGVQPNGEEKHLMEQAHPESVIISPSYDKINGLVENNIERHNIMVNQVLRPNDGNINHRKLAAQAKQELVFELVRIANDLDIRGEDALRALADDCIEKMADVNAGLIAEADFWDNMKSFFSERGDDAVQVGKGAVAGAAIGGIIGTFVAPGPGTAVGAGIGAVSGGLIAAVTKTSPQAKSVVINSASTIGEIDDLLKTKQDPFLLKLRENIAKLQQLATDYTALTSNVQSSQATSEQSKKITSDYLAEMAMVKTLAAEFVTKSKTGQFADPEESEFWSKVKTPMYAFMNDDVADVNKQLEALLRTIKVAQEGMLELKTLSVQSAQNKQEATSINDKLNAPDEAPVPAAPSTTTHAAPPSGVANQQKEENIFSLE